MDFLSILDLIIAAYGVYFLSQWFKVRVKGEKLDPKSFLPGDMTLETCRDPEGFQRALLPQLLLFGLALLGYGAFCIANVQWDFLGCASTAVYFGCGALVVVWYALLIRGLRRRFGDRRP